VSLALCLESGVWQRYLFREDVQLVHRPIDLHIKGFKSLGAQVDVKGWICHCDRKETERQRS
jgi:hypothetical protein